MAQIMRRVVGLMGGAGILLGSVLGGASASRGQATTSLHDIPWYMSHDAARSATLNLCRNDHRFAHDADCLNAETAEDRLWGQRAARGAVPGQKQAQKSGGLFDELTSPQYWADNRLARIGTLGECKTALSRFPPDVCAAAQQGEALDAARRGRR